MSDEAIKLGGKKKSKFIDKVKEILPEGGNLESLSDLRGLLFRMPGYGIGRHGPQKVFENGGIGNGR
jgi:hypothetical protein